MRRTATTILLITLCLTAQSALAQFTTNWERCKRTDCPAARPAWWGAGDSPTFQRGLAYGVVNGNERLYVASRGTDGTAKEIRALNPDTGADIATNFNLTNVTGGDLVINDINVTDGGEIVVCNVTTNTTTIPFRCYFWETEDGEFDQTLVYSNDLIERLGDHFTVVGSLSDNSIVLYAPVSNSDPAKIYKFTTDDQGENWNVEPVVVSAHPYGSPASVAPTAPADDVDFYTNSHGQAARKYAADGTFIAAVVNSPSASTSSTYLDLGTNRYLFMYDYYLAAAPYYYRAALLDVTDGPEEAVVTFTTPNLDNDDHAAGFARIFGDVDYRIDGGGEVTFFVLSSVAGLGSYTGTALPVELVAFEARADGETVRLAWSTASELNNAGFEIQRRLGDGFAGIGFVEGAGNSDQPREYAFTVTDLSPGTHAFRLRQVDFDGSFSYSPIVEVTIELAEGFRLTSAYPNPFNPSTQFELAVAIEQHVTVEVFDVLGRQVVVLHDGLVPANEPLTFTFNGADLPSGLYVYRAIGENFSQTRQVTLLK